MAVFVCLTAAVTSADNIQRYNKWIVQHDRTKPLIAQQTIADNRLLGLWRMMTGYRALYLAAVVASDWQTVARSGICSCSLTPSTMCCWHSPLRFRWRWWRPASLLLAVLQRWINFPRRALGGKTSESIVRRLRDFCMIVQRLSLPITTKCKQANCLQRSTSDVDTLRRFYAEQTIGFG